MPSFVKVGVANIFYDLVRVVGHIASEYKRKLGNLKAGQTCTINFDPAFGNQVHRIWHSKNLLYNNIWTFKLSENFSTSCQSLWQRLQPSIGPFVQETAFDDVLEQQSE